MTEDSLAKRRRIASGKPSTILDLTLLCETALRRAAPGAETPPPWRWSNALSARSLAWGQGLWGPGAGVLAEHVGNFSWPRHARQAASGIFHHAPGWLQDLEPHSGKCGHLYSIRRDRSFWALNR